jgi:hypothetical protein
MAEPVGLLNLDRFEEAAMPIVTSHARVVHRSQ